MANTIYSDGMSLNIPEKYFQEARKYYEQYDLESHCAGEGVCPDTNCNSSDGIITQKESANGQEMEKQLLHKKYVETMPLGGGVKKVTF